MSTNYVRDEVVPLITANEALAIAIKGEWGTGKTHFWRNDILPKVENTVGKYSYASLYQIQSIAELRREIAYSLRNQGPNRWWNRHWRRFRKWREQKGVDGLSRVLRTGIGTDTSLSAYGFKTVLSLGAAADEAMFIRIQNAVICIDDIERRGDSLILKELFALINYLVEARRCIVVVLLNFDQLTEDDRAEWLSRSEKIFDRDLSFSPTLDEVTCIAVPSFVDDRWREFIADRLRRLKVTNIRVATRARRVAESLCRELIRQEPDIEIGILEAVVASAIPFSVIHSEGGNGAPDLRSVVAPGYLFKPQSGMTDIEKQWQKRLSDYGLYFGDALDVAIAESVINGYPISTRILEAVKKYQADAIDQQKRAAVSSAWRKYHDSFAMNDEEVASDLYLSLRQVASVEAISNVEAGARILRAAGHAEWATEVLRLWANGSISSQAADPFLDFSGDHPKDPEMLALLEKAKKEVEESPPVSLKDALLQLNQFPLKRPQKHALSRISVELPESIAEILIDTPTDWHPLMRNVLPRSFPESSEQAVAAKNIREALDLVAQSSTLNRDRVENKFRRLEG